MFTRTAASVIDVATLFRLAIFKDFLSTLFSYAINVVLTLAVIVLMKRMHSGAYEVFYNFVTGALNPSTLIVMASLVIVLIGFEFILVGVTSFQKGYVPSLALKFVFSIRNSIVMQSGVVLALAVVMFASNPVSRWEAYATAWEESRNRPITGSSPMPSAPAMTTACVATYSAASSTT